MTNCSPVLFDLFLYYYEAEFIQQLIRKAKQNAEGKVFNPNFNYTHDVLSINNPNFANWIRLIYPKELEIKETTKTAPFASLLDIYYHFTLLLEIEIQISKLKVNYPPWVSNTMQPNVRRRPLFLCVR